MGLRVRRGVINGLRKLGPDSRTTHAVVRSVCKRRGVACTFDRERVSLVRGDREILLPGRHTLFAPYVADNFDVFAASVTPRMVDGRRVADFSGPGVHHYTSLDADFEMPAFPEAIAFDDEYFKYGAPAAGDLVFDLGANVGLVAYALAQQVGPGGRVVSFEPDPDSLDYLTRNVTRHRLEQVTVEPLAIAPEAGRLEFYAEGTITSGLASARRDSLMTQSMGSVITIDAITLADAVERHGMPAWIKMDIEGAEIDVIAGVRDLLSSYYPHMVIDTSHWVGGETTAARVEALLTDIGYSVVTEEPGGSQLTWAWREDAPPA
jgi:FkbM family methyltransferase